MRLLENMSSYALPCIMFVLAGIMLFSRRDAFAAFTDGASSGLKVAVGLLPTLTALCVAVRMLDTSGVGAALAELLSPLADFLMIPAGILPLLLTRPFSGSASSAAYAELLSREGADSFTALCASVILASSDTAVYVCAVYYSSVGIKRTRHTLPVALAVMLLCVFLSCFLCRIFFT